MSIVRHAQHHGAHPSGVFLRWAGGKRWLVPLLQEIFFGRRFDRYVEPFLGGGSLYLDWGFSMATSYLLSDIEAAIVDTFQGVRNDPCGIIRRLRAMPTNEKAYYRIRKLGFNGNREKNAARFIFLNRLAWNGLFRRNLKGEFNVPYSPKEIPLDLFDRILCASRRLRSQPGKVMLSSYESIIAGTRAGDLLVLDPPYVEKTLGRTRHRYYNVNQFSWADHETLSRAASQAVRRGVVVVITQGRGAVDSLYVGKPFFKLLCYRDQVIAAKSKFRSKTKEIVLISRNSGVA